MELNEKWPVAGKAFRFQKWVWQFVNEKGLLGTGDNVLVAVSTGADSMALLTVALWWKSLGLIKNVRVIHINHQTREQCAVEENFLRGLSKKLSFELIVEKWSKQSESNLENEARNFRYQMFVKHRMQNEKVLLGHHLDDSFEWSLLQQMRGASVKSMLGIPLKNGHFLRPFLCVSRAHIDSFLKLMKVEFYEDHTNQDLRFERNYLRQKVIPLMAQRHPQYLKHYAMRSNQLAEKLGLSLRNQTSFQISRSSSETLIYSHQWRSLPLSLIQDEIHRLSLSKRGGLGEQIKKLMAMKNGKEGPLTFSGGVVAMIDGPLLYLYQQEQRKQLLSWSNEAEFNLVDIYKELTRVIDSFPGSFPFLVHVSNAPKGLHFRKMAHNLLPDLDFTSGDSILSLPSLIKQWSEKREWKNLTLKVRFYT